MTTTAVVHQQLFINNEWRDASGRGTLDVVNPATEEVIATLHPLLMGRENTIPIVKTELAALRSVMASLAAAHGGRLPSNAKLTQAQTELLDGTR